MNIYNLNNYMNNAEAGILLQFVLGCVGVTFIIFLGVAIKNSFEGYGFTLYPHQKVK